MSFTALSNEDWNDLIQSFLDGDLTADERRDLDLLLADAEFRMLLAEYAIDHTQIYEVAQQGILESPGSKLSGEPGDPRRYRNHWGWWAAATILVAVGVGVLLMRGAGKDVDNQKMAIGRVTPIAGQVRFEHDGHMNKVAGDVDLYSGTTLHVTGLAGLARVTLDDGTVISLTGDTKLQCVRQDDQTMIVLRQGQISANVVPQADGRPLLIHTPNAEIEVIGTRLAVGNENQVSEVSVHDGRVRFKRLSDGQSIEVAGGQYAVASQRSELKAQPWPSASDHWKEDFEDGLPEGWRYGQWLTDNLPSGSRGAVRASRRFAMNDVETDQYRITLPKRWTRGLWRIHEDSRLVFTYKMSRPGWFQVMMGVRSGDLDPSYVGNYELQCSHWPKAPANQWQTVSVPLSAFRKNIRNVDFSSLPTSPPRPDDIVSLLWFSTGKVDRGLVIDQIWIDRSDQPIEGSL